MGEEGVFVRDERRGGTTQGRSHECVTLGCVCKYVCVGVERADGPGRIVCCRGRRRGNRGLERSPSEGRGGGGGSSGKPAAVQMQIRRTTPQDDL